MKIALAQLNYHIGNFESNTQKIIESIKAAKAQHADLVVFSELAVCGYPARDFLEFEEFIDHCDESIRLIAAECVDIAAVVGAPSVNPKLEGKNLFNSAYFLENGVVKAKVNKTLLPTYDVFDEYRYFEPNTEFKLIEFKGKKIALTICEDLWNVDEDPLYVKAPMDELIHQKPDLMINIAASPFDYRHREDRLKVLGNNCEKYNLPLIYVNHIGAQTELIFDGGSMVMNANGSLVEEMNYFEEDLSCVEFNSDLITLEADKAVIAGAWQNEDNSSSLDVAEHESIERIYNALVLGIKDYFTKSGFNKAILGMSGGIDSAVVLALAAEALGKDNVLPVLMPSQYSTDHSIDDSIDMVNRIGCKHEIIPIKDIFETFESTLKPQFKDLPFNLTEENMQARIRGVLLMAMSNKFGYILLNTSNKSENAVGYGTLYGDMCGGLSVIGDVYKMQVFALARYINRNGIIIPENIITKAPSAELRPDQKDSDSLPEYEVLDKVLYQYIELRKSSKEIIAQGYDEALVKRILRLVNINEYKRHQTPPILRVSSKAFGVGRRMPIVGKYIF
ncbi:NAD+ synthase [Solitalea longa]|uniref:Glutamine-dependent NAD(+) synthetase n=1 Tax=Solitalea longa TaxID=2079460 RepID=A0A2S4ZYT1_9SPHI|nr:NAD+ synthase [Solitalea longa]POY35092.1 NAD+ synthase [Solitalea longa]